MKAIALAIPLLLLLGVGAEAEDSHSTFAHMGTSLGTFPFRTLRWISL